ncbi:hypothetical protein HQ585_02945 [candidate division KSB1 bacterium]|nr:hypothetical protein [candidate division KSB1 bacterium]
MKRFILIIGILLMAGYFLNTAGFTQTGDAQTVESTGIGYITGGDIAHARDDAVEDALRKGIEQVLGTLVESETLVENFQLIEDNIMTKTQGYVQTYEIVQEKKRSAEMYEVTVRALLKVANIQDDLDGIATLMRRKNTPRTMVIIQEQNIGETPGMHYFDADINTAETAIMDWFMAKGFRFVDPDVVRQNMDQQTASAILTGNSQQAASLGKNLGAEVVITGKAVAKATETVAFGATIRSQQATVAVRAIRTDTGDIIATGSGQGRHPHIDDMTGGVIAIKQASEKVSEELMGKILDRWQSDVSTGSTIVLHVRGLQDYMQLNKFKNSLKYYVRGLQTTTQRSFADGYAVLEVVMKGNADDLAQRLSGKDIEGMQAKVTGMTQNSVSVQLSTPGTAQ